MSHLYKNTYRVPSARHPTWDYSTNAYYFVTICTHNKTHYFGHIQDRQMVLNKLGEIAEKLWQAIPKHFPYVDLDQYTIMPNHIHGIIGICKDTDYDTRRDESLTRLKSKQDEAVPRLYNEPKPAMSAISPHKGSLATIIGSYKSACTKELRKRNPKFSWQTRYYDKIIRNQRHLLAIRKYIYDNPTNWRQDKYFG